MPSLKTVHQTTFTFRSDVAHARRASHRSGILHARKKAFVCKREEHAFAWLDDGTREASVEAVVSHLVRFGFDEGAMLFVPFSSKENWMQRYPHACPFVECDENGTIKGLIVGPNPDAFQDAASNSSPKGGGGSGRPTQRQNRGKKIAPKLVPSAVLVDAERARLHVEIYNYFSWLNDRLSELEDVEGGRARIVRAGISVPAMRNLLAKMENTFRNVGELKASEDEKRRKEGGEEASTAAAAAGTGAANDQGEATNLLVFASGATARGNDDDNEKENDAQKSAMPLLEKCLEVDLRRVVKEQTGASVMQEVLAKKYNERNFDHLIERLMAFKRRRGNFDVPHQFKDGNICLGRWVADIRIRKRALLAKGLGCEVPVENSSDAARNDFINVPISPGRLGLTLQFYKSAIGGVIAAIDPGCTFKTQVEVGDRLVTIDGDVVSSKEDLSIGKDNEVRILGIAKKKAYPSNYLSMERAERLDSIGFTFVGAPPAVMGWDERFARLKQYKETHGKWPPHREKWEGIGEWVHNQRRRYAQKDKKFLAERAPKLDEIGFPWSVRKSSVRLSWEDCIQKLMEFHRVNRHFNVPRPESVSRGEGEDELEHMEAQNFYRWFKQLNTWHRSHRKGDRSLLTEDRVNQLLELGFKFEDEVMRNARRSWDASFDALVEFWQAHGHTKVPQGYRADPPLAVWVARQRTGYKLRREGKPSKLTQERYEKLESVGFVWEAKMEARNRIVSEYCSEQRVHLGMKHTDYCRMCYRKQGKEIKSRERQRKCKSSRMGCPKCQEPICGVCWDEGYDKHLVQQQE